MTEDLVGPALSAALGDRPVRAYPALLSTEAEAMAWARAGAPSGAVVVADYQASPRGRAGLPWQVRAGADLGFSLVLHPELTPEREGWLYVAAATGLGDVLAASQGSAADATVGYDWPDTVRRGGGRPPAQLGCFVQPGPVHTSWAVVTVLVTPAPPPRGPLLAALAEAIERRVSADPATVLADYRPRCASLGRAWRARMIPLGPAGAVIEGTAADVLADGALVLRTARGSRVAVRPQHLGLLQDPAADPPGPAPAGRPVRGRRDGSTDRPAARRAD